jgi:hypothetical protein
MGLKKGMTNNPNGRPAGSKNRTTAEIRDLLKEFVSANWETIQTDFDQLPPKDRLAFFEKVLQYTIPKMQSVNHEFELRQKLEKMTETEIDDLINRIYHSHEN